MKTTLKLSLLMLALLAGRAGAATYYFNNSTGSDMADCSIGTPCKTFAKAATVCTGADTICDFNGTYTTPFSVPASGTEGHRITYRANSPGDWIINGGGADVVLIDGAAKSHYVIDGAVLHNSLGSGFRANAATGETVTITPGASGTDVIVRNVIVHDVGVDGGGMAGISITGTIDGTVEDCEVYDTSMYFALRAKWATRPTFQRNHVHDCSADGLVVNNSTAVVVTQNIIADMWVDPEGPGHQDGITIAQLDGFTISRNVVRQWTQLIYWPGADDIGSYLKNGQIWGNVIYSVTYGDPNDPTAGAPGVFLDGFAAQVRGTTGASPPVFGGTNSTVTIASGDAFDTGTVSGTFRFEGVGGGGPNNTFNVVSVANATTVVVAGDASGMVGGQQFLAFATSGDYHTIQNIEIFGNTFGYTGLPAIRIYGNSCGTRSGFRFYNNIFFKVRGNGTNAAIDVEALTSVASDYNSFYTCTAPGYEGAHSLSSDPKLKTYTGFGSAGYDFGLLVSSPCIGAGITDLDAALIAGLPAAYADYAGYSRSGVSDDVGAYDYDSGSGQTAPGAPTGLGATAISSTRIDLAWTAPASNGGSPITGYRIDRESPIAGGFAILVEDTENTATAYSDVNLTAETQYNYKVYAINAIGTSSASSPDDATTLAAEGQPATVQRRISVGIQATLIKNLAGQKVPVYAYDIDGLAVVGDAANITAKISRDGGVAVDLADAHPVEIDPAVFPGIYIFDVTQAETNADLILFAAVSSTESVLCDPQLIYTRVLETGDAYAATQSLLIYAAANNDAVDMIRAKTDFLTFDGYSVQAKLAADGLDDIAVETGMNARQAMSLTSSVLFGNYAKSGGAYIFRAAGVPGSERVQASLTTDTRTILSLTPPS